jgi:hypothetical protein
MPPLTLPPLSLPLCLFAIMSSFLSPIFLDLHDFSTNFPDNIDFGAEFNFGGDSNFFANNSDDTIGTGLYKYDGVLCDFSVKGSERIRQHRHRQKRRQNRCYQAKSVKKSCWYINFIQPG